MPPVKPCVSDLSVPKSVTGFLSNGSVAASTTLVAAPSAILTVLPTFISLVKSA